MSSSNNNKQQNKKKPMSSLHQHALASKVVCADDDSSISFRLKQVLSRHKSNQNCCDCRAKLLQSRIGIHVVYSMSISHVSYCVFVCDQCSKAHKKLESNSNTIKSILSESSWSFNETDILMNYNGSNDKANSTLERYMSDFWKERIPSDQTRSIERETFIRVKYHLLAFALPNGRMDSLNWASFLNDNADGGSSILNGSVSNSSVGSSLSKTTNSPPNRLIDYFCVFGASDHLENNGIPQSVTTMASPEEMRLDPMTIDCYPSSDFHADCKLPSQIAKFVFPDGCRPSLTEQDPTLFPFVLTEESGMKLYGTALIVHDEEIETIHLSEVLQNSGYDGPLPTWLEDEAKEESSTTTTVTSSSSDEKDIHSVSLRSTSSDLETRHVLLPKALVVLSHYPFFDSMRVFLLQLFRICLNGAPLPIERYVMNFVREIPLPPLGKVEIKFSFTDVPCSISRPPKNKLPLFDLSYRPLFSALSVGNIITIVGCLLTESKIAICSTQYSLLTPACEALLSFLFPLTWVGVYIPVMPFSMLDVLDAPVPFIVGLHRRCLDMKQRPLGVVFVDLDNDTVHLGYDDSTADFQRRKMPRFPPKDVGKLKAKLDKSGGCAYADVPGAPKGRITWGDGERIENGIREIYGVESYVPTTAQNLRKVVFDSIGFAFPNNEHLENFSSSEGLLIKKEEKKTELEPTKSSLRSRARAIRAKRRSAIRRRLGYSEDKAAAAPISIAPNIFDKSRDEGAEDGFSATEVRDAFLRLFVSIFRHYDKCTATLEGNMFSSADFLTHSTNLPERCRSFMEQVTSTQLFENFIFEKLVNSNQSDFLFFDESIIAKQNRSQFQRTKVETPFLSDTADEITEIYTPPPPNNWGLPNDEGTLYIYPSFPKLSPELFGSHRQPKQWVQVSQRKTNVLPANFPPRSDITKKLTLTPTQIAPWSLDENGEEIPDRDAYWAVKTIICLTQHNSSSNSPSPSQKDRTKVAILKNLAGLVTCAETILFDELENQTKILIALVKVQALVRMVLVRVSYDKTMRSIMIIQREIRIFLVRKKHKSIFNKFCANVMTLQKAYRKYRERRHRRNAILIQCFVRSHYARRQLLQLKLVRRSVICIQTRYRAHVARANFLRSRNAVITIQSIMRRARARKVLLIVRDMVIRVQAMTKGHLVRRAICKERQSMIARYRKQIFLLWQRCFTSFVYRASFWKLCSSDSFLMLALHEEELLLLWKELVVQQIDAKRRKIAEYGSLIPRNLFLEGREINAAPFPDEINRKGDGVGLIAFEKAWLYDCCNNMRNSSNHIFSNFEISGSKRKRRLIEAIWASREKADDSSSFVIEMVSISSTNKPMQQTIKLTSKAKRLFKVKLKYDVSRISAQDKIDAKKKVAIVAFSAASFAMWTANCEEMKEQNRSKDDFVQIVRNFLFT